MLQKAVGWWDQMRRWCSSMQPPTLPSPCPPWGSTWKTEGLRPPKARWRSSLRLVLLTHTQHCCTLTASHSVYILGALSCQMYIFDTCKEKSCCVTVLWFWRCLDDSRDFATYEWIFKGMTFNMCHDWVGSSLTQPCSRTWKALW